MCNLLIILLFLSAARLHGQAKSSPDPTTTISILNEGNGVKLRVWRIAYAQPKPLARRTLLLVHGGGPGSIATFNFEWLKNKSFAIDLAKRGFVVYLMDVRGWEDATAPPYDPTDTSLVAGSCVEAAADIDVVVDYIRKAEYTDRVNLFGWATGGHWISYYTTLHNDKVDNLIVLNSLYGVKGPWSLNSAFADPADSNRYNNRLPVYRESTTQAVIDARLNAVPFADKNAWIDTSTLADYADFATAFNPQHTLKVPGGYRRESFYMAHGYQYWNARNITRPVLILRSQYDFWSRPIDPTAYFNDLVNSPRKQSIQLKDATHFVFLDRPAKGRDQLLAAIDQFVSYPLPFNLTIDSLQTDDQVIEFIRQFDGEYYSVYPISTIAPYPHSLQEYQTWRQSFGAQTWEKGDFDGNGRTDLLFNGCVQGDFGDPRYYQLSLVLLNDGADGFRIVRIMPTPLQLFAAKKIILDGHDHIATLQVKRSSNQNVRDTSPTQTDTLNYAFDHFIERKQQLPTHSIQSFSYCNVGGGSSPQYGMLIRGNLIKYRISRAGYPKSRWDSGGIFQARLDTATVHRIYGLLHYLDLPSLKKGYEVPGSDSWTAILKMKYDHGKSLEIDDNGEIGTYGLRALYDLLKSLPDNPALHWVKIAPLDEYADGCFRTMLRAPH